MDRWRNHHVVQRGNQYPKKLILAAAACTENSEDDDEERTPPPPELRLAWQVEQWGKEAVLGDGAVSANLLARMTAARNVYNAFVSFRAGSDRLADWARANPVYSQIVTNIRRMRQQAND